MAGTARMVPAITPLTTSCAISASRGGIARSGNLQQRGLASADLVVAELAVEDVTDVGEVAGAAGPLVVDLLALRQQLQAFHGAVDLGATALRDLAHAVVNTDARGDLRFGDGKHDEARPVCRLGLVRIRLGDAKALFCQVICGRAAILPAPHR